MAVKTLQLRRPDTCSRCSTHLDVGVVASWDNQTKTVTCVPCTGPAPAPAPVVSAGIAGQSAARQYEKRSARERQRKEAVVQKDAQWRADAVAKRPVLGRLQTVLTPKPTIGPESQSTKAWKI